MRAGKPDIDGYAERNGVKVYYEVSGTGAPTILLLPAWPVGHSRAWKMRCPTWRATTASSLSTGGATAARTVPRVPGATWPPSTRPTPWL